MEIVYKLATKFKRVGSRDICPERATRITDEDFLCLTTPFKAVLVRIYLWFRFYTIRSGSTYSITLWGSYSKSGVRQLSGFEVWKRKGSHHKHESPSDQYNDIDVLLTTSEVFFYKFMKAHNICKDEKIHSKAKRLVVFQKILYNNTVNVGDMEVFLKEKNHDI